METIEAPKAVRAERPASVALAPPPAVPPSGASRTTVGTSELQKFDMWFRIGYWGLSGVLLLFWFVIWVLVGFAPDLPPDEPFFRFLFSMAAYGLFQLALYLSLLPTKLAIRRRRPDRMLIICLNVLLGWTLVGWASSLRWVLTGKGPETEGTSESQHGLTELRSFDGLFDIGYKLMAGIALLPLLPVYFKPSLFPYHTQLGAHPLEVYRLTAFSLWGLFELGLYLYLLPARLAIRRKKPNRMLIFAFDVLLGWTLVGWAISLSWALARDEPTG